MEIVYFFICGNDGKELHHIYYLCAKNKSFMMSACYGDCTKKIYTFPIQEFVPNTGRESPDAPDTKVLHYEALKIWNNGATINEWVNDIEMLHRHFLDSRVGDFCRIYDSVNDQFKYSNMGDEMQERKAFSRNPFYVVVIDDKVGGGVWIEKGVKSCGHAHFHIVVLSEYRGDGTADFLLDSFEKASEDTGRYHSLSCEWGPRKDCNPNNFFKRHGYDVIGSLDGGGHAWKSLDDFGSDSKIIKKLQENTF